MNSLEKFNNEGLALMQGVANVLKQKKEIEAQEKKLKANLLDLMEEYKIKSVDNEFLKITYVDGSESVSIDLKALEAREPDLYNELLKDYEKTTKRKASIRITVR